MTVGVALSVTTWTAPDGSLVFMHNARDVIYPFEIRFPHLFSVSGAWVPGLNWKISKRGDPVVEVEDGFVWVITGLACSRQPEKLRLQWGDSYDQGSMWAGPWLVEGHALAVPIVLRAGAVLNGMIDGPVAGGDQFTLRGFVADQRPPQRT